MFQSFDFRDILDILEGFKSIIIKILKFIEFKKFVRPASLKKRIKKMFALVSKF